MCQSPNRREDTWDSPASVSHICAPSSPVGPAVSVEVTLSLHSTLFLEGSMAAVNGGVMVLNSKLKARWCVPLIGATPVMAMLVFVLGSSADCLHLLFLEVDVTAQNSDAGGSVAMMSATNCSFLHSCQ